MNSHSTHSEWSLVAFTLALQLSCGLVLAAAVSDWERAASGPLWMRPLGIAVFPVAAAGLLCSLLHLGRPSGAGRSLLNLKQSRLSQEVLLTLLFLMLSFAYSILWLMDSAGLRRGGGIATALCAVAAVAASAALYWSPAMPLWNSGWVLASFAGSTVLLGGFAAMSAASSAGDSGMVRFSLAAVLAGSLLVLVALLWMLLHWARCFKARQAPGRPDLRRGLWLGLHVVLAVALPALLAIKLMLAQGSAAAPGGPMSARWLWTAFLLSLLGAAFGRAFMYWLGTSCRF
jgi:anaerobic dimethyl sulfoxide reductase subunit C (anchor subunit)